MRLSIAFPNVGPAQDPAALRDYAMGLEAAGADALMVVDHVVYAWDKDGVRRSQYNPATWQLEPFATMGFLAGITQSVILETGIVILPQRPPALVAKEAATIDYLSGGRLRLGVGLGWQAPEYEAMGVPFGERGVEIALNCSVKIIGAADHSQDRASLIVEDHGSGVVDTAIGVGRLVA